MTTEIPSKHSRTGKPDTCFNYNILWLVLVPLILIVAFVQLGKSRERTGADLRPVVQYDQEDMQSLLSDISELRRTDLENLGLASAGSLVELDKATTENLEKLAQCTTLECVSRNHPKLGSTKFNFPHFFILGWQKSATSSIFRHLTRHPEIAKPFVKEPHFFTACQRDGPACKVAGGNSERAYIRDTFQIERTLASGLTLATLDASVDYAQYGEDMASKLKQLFPWAKLVFVMRERIGRAISWKNMLSQKFDRGCGDNLAGCLGGSLRKSNYTSPMQAWLKHFPPEQIQVMQFESIAEQPDVELAAMKTFLGLDPAQPPAELRNVNARPGSRSGWPMKRDAYDELVKGARADGMELIALLEKHNLLSQTEGLKWMARWEAVWSRNLESCNESDDCNIVSSFTDA